jgi:hypothetical protein
MPEWKIQVRHDVDSPWVDAVSEDLDSDVYETKAEAKARIKDMREIGLLNPYDGVRAVLVEE